MNEKRIVTFRKINDKSRKRFTGLLLEEDWAGIEKPSSTESAAALAAILDKYVDMCFPLRTVVIRARDPAWITPFIRRKIRRRKKYFKKHGRNEEWKTKKKETDELIAES